jgi:hypothetical protein
MPDLTHVIAHLEQHTARTVGNPEMHGQFTQALAILKAAHAQDNDEVRGDPPAQPTDPNDRAPSDG